MPNPILIKDPEENAHVVAFTSCKRQEYASFESEKIPEDEDGKQRNTVTEEPRTSYPTIFFYSLAKKKIIWEIFGADAFLKINQKKQVFYLANEKWTGKPDERRDQDALAVLRIKWKSSKIDEDQDSLAVATGLFMGSMAAKVGLRSQS